MKRYNNLIKLLFEMRFFAFHLYHHLIVDVALDLYQIVWQLLPGLLPLKLIFFLFVSIWHIQTSLRLLKLLNLISPYWCMHLLKSNGLLLSEQQTIFQMSVLGKAISRNEVLPSYSTFTSMFFNQSIILLKFANYSNIVSS